MAVVEGKQPTAWQRFGHGLAVTVSGILLALACFLVLPLLQAITQPEPSEFDYFDGGAVELPPPPPVEPEKEEDKSDPEPPPPAPSNDAPPLDLSDLEMALNPGFGAVGTGGGFALPLNALLQTTGNNMNQLFDMGDLEESPRVIFRARPDVTLAMRKRMPCTVFIVMDVDATGQVQNPVVVRSDDPMFNEPALKAIRKWKFEPGKRGGKPDLFRVRQPMTFQ